MKKSFAIAAVVSTVLFTGCGVMPSSPYYASDTEARSAFCKAQIVPIAQGTHDFKQKGLTLDKMLGNMPPELDKIIGMKQIIIQAYNQPDDATPTEVGNAAYQLCVQIPGINQSQPRYSYRY